MKGDFNPVLHQRRYKSVKKVDNHLTQYFIMTLSRRKVIPAGSRSSLIPEIHFIVLMIEFTQYRLFQ